MVASFVSALLISLLAYALITWVLYGWGSLFMRFLKITLPALELPLSQIWIGWALALVLLQLLHFAMPLNWLATTIVMVGGLLAWGIQRPTWTGLSYSPRTIAFSIAILLTAIWLATQSMRPLANYDTGLYHLQSVRWYNEYAIVPGLGNIHGRLAFNQAFFAFPAALNFYPIFSPGHTLANSFLFLLLASEGWRALILQRGQRSVSRFVVIFALPFVAGLSLRETPSSATPDTATAILQMVIWLQFVRLLEDASPAQHLRSRIHTIAILATTAITVKLSNLAFVAGVGLVILYYYWLVQPGSLRQTARYLLQFLWIPLLFLLVWMARGYVHSGYPLYPLAMGGMDVDWRMPLSSLELERRSIYLWARHGRMSDLQSDWILIWLEHVSRLWGIYPTAATLCMAAAFVVIQARTRAREVVSREVPAPYPYLRRLPLLPAIAFPLLVGLLFWWLTAPDIRFARALISLATFLTAYLLWRALERVGWGDSRWNLAAIMLFVNLAILFAFVIGAATLVQLPAGFAAYPTTELVTHTLPEGLTVYVPEQGDQCGDAPLPCVPSPYNLNFEMRGETLQQGFRAVE